MSEKVLPSFGEALLRGLRLARRSPAVIGLAVLAEVAQSALALAVVISLGGTAFRAAQRALSATPPEVLLASPETLAASFLRSFAHGREIVPLAGAAVSAALLAGALHLLWLSAAARVFKRRLSFEEPGHVIAEAASGLPRAVAALGLGIPLLAGATLFGLAATTAGGFVYLRALELESGGFLGALSLALAFSLMVMVVLPAGLVFRLSLLRATAGDEGPVSAVIFGCRLLVERPGTLLGISGLFGLAQAVATAASNLTGVVVIGSGPAAVALSVALRLAAGLASAFLVAAITTAELGALATLEAADRGGIAPDPPREAPAEVLLPTETVLPTEVVHETEPVG
jgi:hypothetical protein